jgi:cation transport ATPase
VVTAHGLDGVVRAVEIAQRSRRIARQSAVGGMSMAGVAMIFAAFGYLPPALGAVVQEVIDLAVILNALRALKGRRAKDRLVQRSERTREREVVGRG